MGALGCMLVVAFLVAFFASQTTAQRMAALSMISVGLTWLVILILALARTPEGLDRLSSSPAVALELLSAVPFVVGPVLVDVIVNSGRIWTHPVRAGSSPRRNTSR